MSIIAPRYPAFCRSREWTLCTAFHFSEQNAIDPERRGEVGEILVEYKAHRDTGANLEPVLFFNSRIYCYLLELRVVEWLIMEWMLQSRQTPCEGWDYIPTDACQENGIRTF